MKNPNIKTQIKKIKNIDSYSSDKSNLDFFSRNPLAGKNKRTESFLITKNQKLNKEVKMSKTNLTVTILIILLLVAVGYIGYTKYTNWNNNRQLSAYQQGAQYGSDQAIAYIYDQAKTCQQLPITIQNQTINLIAVECLQQAQQQAQ